MATSFFCHVVVALFLCMQANVSAASCLSTFLSFFGSRYAFVLALLAYCFCHLAYVLCNI